MQLLFLGTRGNIKPRTPQHNMHSALLLTHRRKRILIDAGEDWLGRLADLAPDAIVLTHAHPDHAFALRQGAPCPVYATPITWQLINDFPINDRRAIPATRRITIEGLAFRAFPVQHSITAPAVGYRITPASNASNKRPTIFYAPDLAHLPDAERALHKVDLYIGDGATLTRPMVWPAQGTLIGHAPIKRQLGWCQKAGVPKAIFTHCGSGIVTANPAQAAAQVQALGQAAHVQATIASDGDTVTFD